MNDKINETQLITRAQAGDAAAFGELYGRYKDRYYRYAYYRLGNTPDAEDAVSDGVVDMWKGIAGLRSPEVFATWSFRILSKKCAAYIDRQVTARRQDSLEAVLEQGREGSVVGHAGEASPAGQEDPALRLALRQALDKLTDEEREIVLLAVVAGFSGPEIGDILGLRPGTVRSKQSRALKKLRAELEK